MKTVTFLSFFLLIFSSALHASVVVTNGLTHKHAVSSGSVEKGLVLLKNIGKEPTRVLVYMNDLKVGCNATQLDVANPGTQDRSNSKWIKVGMEERLLQPGEEFPLRYEINAPTENLEGSYWSLLMVEVKKPIDTVQHEYGVKVSSNVRYAVQIITDFATQKATDVQFKDVQLTKTPQGKAMAIELGNNCGKMVQPIVKLEIYNESGELLVSKKAETKKLYPGQCRVFNLPVAELPTGKFQAVLVADCGESDLFGMTLNLDIE